MTTAQKAIAAINKLNHPFTQAFVLDAVAKNINTINESGVSDKELADSIDRGSSGMVNGVVWVASIREVEKVLVEHNLMK